MNNDAILLALSYSINEGTSKQLQAILNRFDFNEAELKAIVTLNDRLKQHLAYIAMSNSQDCFKIKNDGEVEEIRAEVRKIIDDWAKKNKFILEKVPNKETYYILK